VPTAGITLWRSKRGGKQRGFIRASWREAGRKVTWDTRTLDAEEARRLAVAELNRRLSSSSSIPSVPPDSQVSTSTKPPVQPAGDQPAPAQPSNVIPLRRPIGEALNRALGNGAAAAIAPSSAPVDADEAKKKTRKLYEVFGKAMGFLTEGGLKRACRWAGREPEDMDDDEIELVREGWEEKGADWFGRTNIGPWGKIALGSAVAGVGMYMGGKPLPAKKLPPAKPADGANVRPEREGGEGGGVG
jgi:hypothetical protein